MKATLLLLYIVIILSGLVPKVIAQNVQGTAVATDFRCPYCGEDLGLFTDKAAGEAALQRHLATCPFAPHGQALNGGGTPDPAQQMMINAAGQFGNQIGQAIANSIFGANKNSPQDDVILQQRRWQAAREEAKRLDAQISEETQKAAQIAAQKKAQEEAEQAKAEDEQNQRLVAELKGVGVGNGNTPLKTGTPFFGIPANPDELTLKGLGDSEDLAPKTGPDASVGHPKTAGEQLKSAAAVAAAGGNLTWNYDEGTAPYAGKLDTLNLHPFDPATLPASVRNNPDFEKMNAQWNQLQSQGEELNKQLMAVRQQESVPGADKPNLQVQEANIKQALSQNQYNVSWTQKQMESFTVDMTEMPSPPQDSVQK